MPSVIFVFLVLYSFLIGITSSTSSTTKISCHDLLFSKTGVESIEIESRGCLNISANCPLFHARSLSLENFDDQKETTKILFIGWKNAIRNGIEMITIGNETTYCRLMSKFLDSSKEIVQWTSLFSSPNDDYSHIFIINKQLENETNVEEIEFTFKLKNQSNKTILIYRFPKQNISEFEFSEDFVQILLEQVFTFEELTSIEISVTLIVIFVLFIVLVLLGFALCVDEG